MHRTFVSLEDAFKAIKEIQERVVYYDTDIWNFNQRRITNAHPSIDDYDYVVRKELRDFTKKTTLTIDTGGGTGSTATENRYLRTFGFAVNQNLQVGSDLLPPLIIPFTSTRLEKIYFKAKTAPVGADIIADVLESGVSILNSSKLTVPDGSSAVQTVGTFVTDTFTDSQVLTFDITQVGSSAPGKTLVVTFKFKVIVP